MNSERRTGMTFDCWRFFLAGVAALQLAGCASQRPLMPTPSLYTGTEARPLFVEVPTERRTPSIDLLYFTNRAPLEDQKDKLLYGPERSRSVAFGSVKVGLGPGITWDELEHSSCESVSGRYDDDDSHDHDGHDLGPAAGWCSCRA